VSTVRLCLLQIAALTRDQEVPDCNRVCTQDPNGGAAHISSLDTCKQFHQVPARIQRHG
jgi:hypothetical protein